MVHIEIPATKHPLQRGASTPVHSLSGEHDGNLNQPNESKITKVKIRASKAGCLQLQIPKGCRTRNPRSQIEDFYITYNLVDS